MGLASSVWWAPARARLAAGDALNVLASRRGKRSQLSPVRRTQAAAGKRHRKWRSLASCELKHCEVLKVAQLVPYTGFKRFIEG